MDKRMLGWRRITLSMIISRQPYARITSGRPLSKQAGRMLHHLRRPVQEAATETKIVSVAIHYVMPVLTLRPRWDLHTQGIHHFHCLSFDGLCLGYGIG